MKMETDKPAGIVFAELIFKNLFWYLVFSAIYANTNPLEWWMVQNVWGRTLLVLLEFAIIASIGFVGKIKDNKNSRKFIKETKAMLFEINATKQNYNLDKNQPEPRNI